MKRVQNKVAESRIALPVVACYGVLVWLAAGLLHESWWIQFACAAAATYGMVELNNQNALIRIYSRMVSCAFLVLWCAGSFLFSSMRASLGILCFVAFLLLFARTYQDKESTGTTFYAFIMLGLGSLIHVHALYFLPVFWLFMAFKIQSLSWRTFIASVFGVVLPYWFALVWFIWQEDFSLFFEHFEQLGWVTFPYDYSTVTLPQLLLFILLTVIGTIGAVHYLRTRYKDKIRTRMLFDGFIITASLSAILLALQPQHMTLLLPIMICCVSPLIAHFLALTQTRWTNIAFYVIMVATLALTAYNIIID